MNNMNAFLLSATLLLPSCQPNPPTIVAKQTAVPLIPTATASLRATALPTATANLTATAKQSLCSVDNLMQGLQDISPALRPVALKAVTPLVAKCILGQEITEQDKQNALRTLLCEPGIMSTIDAENGKLGTPTSEPEMLAWSDALFAAMCAEPTLTPVP